MQGWGALPVEKFVDLLFGEQIFKVLSAAVPVFSSFLLSAVNAEACVGDRPQPLAKGASLFT